MFGEVITIGDRVLINIPKENRSWGYNPCPNNTIAEVVGFSTITNGRINNYGRDPGIFENKCQVKVRLPDEKEICISSCHIKPENEETYEQKLSVWRNLSSESKNIRKKIADLPETDFYEGDVVLCSSFISKEEWVIHHIQYEYIGQHRDDGSNMGIYSLSESLNSGSYLSVFGSDELQLVRRGNVWRYYNNEPISFETLQEEAAFHKMLGKTKEIKNPSNGTYSWTKDEILQAIQVGIVHGFAIGFVPYHLTNTSHLSAICFDDEGLGKRIAKETLKGFGL